MTDRRHGLARYRRSAGYSQESLAAEMEVDRRTVARWEAGTSSPHPTQRPQLAALLDLTTAGVEQLLGSGVESDASGAGNSAMPSLSGGVQAGLEWLDKVANSPLGTADRTLRASLRSRGSHAWPLAIPRRVDQSAVAEVLHGYYGNTTLWQQYGARTQRGTLRTSVLTRSDWLDSGADLGPQADGIEFRPDEPSRPVIDEVAYEAAIARLADVVGRDTTLVDQPMYRLMDVSVDGTGLRGGVAMAQFIDYALTMDLLEDELLEAASGPGQMRRMPLRDRFLPDLAAVTDAGARLCAGGALALTAIARPPTARRGGDYVLLVQERSLKVLNGNRRLAVIPKAFHAPLSDVVEDTPIGITLVREMEEELFGRADVDLTIAGNRRADPLHERHLSEPMTWLVEHPQAWRMESTGVGYNLVNGNYEFAGLVVIEDESWWASYGGHIEANWESERLHRYSSRDPGLLDTLAHDPAWSGEGLFALLQGLRRLAATGGTRVDIPDIELDLR